MDDRQGGKQKCATGLAPDIVESAATLIETWLDERAHETWDMFPRIMWPDREELKALAVLVLSCESKTIRSRT